MKKALVQILHEGFLYIAKAMVLEILYSPYLHTRPREALVLQLLIDRISDTAFRW